jgi:hypothetical protein
MNQNPLCTCSRQAYRPRSSTDLHCKNCWGLPYDIWVAQEIQDDTHPETGCVESFRVSTVDSEIMNAVTKAIELDSAFKKFQETKQKYPLCVCKAYNPRDASDMRCKHCWGWPDISKPLHISVQEPKRVIHWNPKGAIERVIYWNPYESEPRSFIKEMLYLPLLFIGGLIFINWIGFPLLWLIPIIVGLVYVGVPGPLAVIIGVVSFYYWCKWFWTKFLYP